MTEKWNGRDFVDEFAWRGKEVERLEAELGKERIITSGISNRKLQAKVKQMEEALTEISKGDGTFNRDRLIHADNCIENMKSIALTALRSNRRER